MDNLKNKKSILDKNRKKIRKEIKNECKFYEIILYVHLILVDCQMDTYLE